MLKYKKYRVVSEVEGFGLPVFFIEGYRWFSWKRMPWGGYFGLEEAVAKCDQLNNPPFVVTKVIYPNNGSSK